MQQLIPFSGTSWMPNGAFYPTIATAYNINNIELCVFAIEKYANGEGRVLSVARGGGITWISFRDLSTIGGFYQTGSAGFVGS